MATLTWRSDDDMPERAIVLASELRLPTWRALAAMMRTTGGVAAQIRASDGAYGYALRVQILRRRMTTVSAWRDEAAIGAFVRAEPHRSVMLRHGGQVIEPRFRTVEVAGDAVVLDADRYLDGGDDVAVGRRSPVGP